MATQIVPAPLCADDRGMSPADRAAAEAASHVRPAASSASWPISDDLAAALARDNKREAAGMHADERETCWTHQSWAEDCADHPMHTDPHGWVLRQADRTVTS